MIFPDLRTQMPEQDAELLGDLLTQLENKRRRNTLRAAYYDMHNLFRDLGISIPPNLRNLEVAMGWPAKAVDLLARRVRFTGFVLPGGDVTDWGIPELWTENRMETEAPQAHTSALIHATAFITTTLGDVAAGEPEVLITAQDAMSATGLWDPVKRGLRAGLSVIESDTHGPLRMVMLTPFRAYGLRRTDDTGTRWEVRAVNHRLGRVPMEPLVYRPRLGRPFGSSRISRAVMSLTDSAMRTVVRAEVGAEFYSAPQRYLLGADEEAFVGPDGARKTTWDLVMGRILAIDADEDGNKPEVGQFPQISMQPHADQMKMWATLFAGETGLPVSALGIVQDNPSSAEAIYASKEDLVIEAEGCAASFAPAWTRSVLTGIQMRDNLPTIPADLRGLGMRSLDPSTPSRAAATDSVMKQIAAGVLPPESDVALEALGYDEVTIRRIQADRRRSVGRSLLASLASGGDAAPAVPDAVQG